MQFARWCRLQIGMDRIGATAVRKRQVALAAMEEAGIDKILEPDFKVL